MTTLIRFTEYAHGKHRYRCYAGDVWEQLMLLQNDRRFIWVWRRIGQQDVPSDVLYAAIKC